MAEAQETRSWVDTFASSQGYTEAVDPKNIGVKEYVNGKSHEYTIYEEKAGYSQKALVGYIKTMKVDGSGFDYTFGLTTQVNFKTQPAIGNVIYNWASVKSVIGEPDHYANFVCSLRKTNTSYAQDSRMTITATDLNSILSAEDKFSGTEQIVTTFKRTTSQYTAPSTNEWHSFSCITYLMTHADETQLKSYVPDVPLKLSAGFALYERPIAASPILQSGLTGGDLEFPYRPVDDDSAISLIFG